MSVAGLHYLTLPLGGSAAQRLGRACTIKHLTEIQFPCEDGIAFPARETGWTSFLIPNAARGRSQIGVLYQCCAPVGRLSIMRARSAHPTKPFTARVRERSLESLKRMLGRVLAGNHFVGCGLS